MPIDDPLKLSAEAPEMPMPRRMRPMRARIAEKPFDDPEWVFEIKWDGRRAVALIENGAVRLTSEEGRLLNKKYPSIAASLGNIRHNIILDGEVVAADGEGHAEGAILKRAERARKGDLFYCTFDILYLDGRDLRGLPLFERKKILEGIVGGLPGIHFNDHIEMEGVAFWNAARNERLHGIIAKNAESPYRDGIESGEWLEFTFAAAPAKPRRAPRSAVVAPLGHREKGVLIGSTVIKLTNLDTIFWPEEKYAKGDLIEYYRKMAPYILPYLIDRPESLHRFPNGIHEDHFFQDNVGREPPDWVETIRFPSDVDRRGLNYILCQNEETLIYLANLGCIDLHTWSSRLDALDNPDYIIFDLNPQEASFDALLPAAREIKKILDVAGIRSYCKTSGATGLHVLVPTGGRYTFDQVKNFAEVISHIVQKRLPKTTVIGGGARSAPKKVRLNFERNARGKTLVAPYAVRPLSGAPVSTPLSWNEIAKGLNPRAFTIKNTFDRVKRRGDIMNPLLDETLDLRAALNKLKFRG